MSFWKTSAGVEATGEVEENGFAPLEKGWYTSMLEEVSVDEYEGVKKIKIKARVIGEGPGKNRVLFLGLKAFEHTSIKESARDRAIQVLVKMYNICGAKLPNGEPDDASLSKLIDKPIDLLLDVWEMNDKEGNWLVNVESRGAKVGVVEKAAPKTKSILNIKSVVQRQAVQSNPKSGFDDMDEDIPF